MTFTDTTTTATTEADVKFLTAAELAWTAHGDGSTFDAAHLSDDLHLALAAQFGRHWLDQFDGDALQALLDSWGEDENLRKDHHNRTH